MTFSNFMNLFIKTAFPVRTRLRLETLGRTCRHPSPFLKIFPLALLALLSGHVLALSSADVPPRPASLDPSVVIGETSHPASSTFIPGDVITLTFWGAGLGSGDFSQTLTVIVKDERDIVLSTSITKVIPDASGNWQTTVPAVNQGVGYYKVSALTSAGKGLPKFGSRGAGYMTYAVVPDPRSRPLVDESKARFGLHGGVSPNLLDVFPYLGIRWVLDNSYAWRANEPSYPGQYSGVTPPAAAYSFLGMPWKTYTLPSIYIDTPDWAVIPGSMPPGQALGVLSPSAEAAWAGYLTKAVKAYAANNVNRSERIYQLTWEPQPPWRWSGTASDLVRVYAIAYSTIHAADPNAKVIGPAGFPDPGESTDWIQSLLDAGLAKYLDGFSIHPYAQQRGDLQRLVGNLRKQKSMVDQSKGFSIMRIGTEQGWTTHGNQSEEWSQATGLLRSDLITLGEGYRFNFTFYIADFPQEPGYGYYYNLNKDIDFGTDKISPKLIVPAYAFYTSLLEGADTMGAIENLGGTAWGYRFTAINGKTVLAFFDYLAIAKKEISVPAASVEIYDWMGRKSIVKSNDGKVTITISPEPTYIVY